MTSSSPRLLECSALMRSDLDEPRNVDLSDQSPPARRRRRLCRGIDRWVTGTSIAGLPSGRVLLVALTFADADPTAARGAIRTFWQHYRKTFGTRPYFSWTELQFRGAVHYHAILINPPWKTRGDAVRWIVPHWPHASITPSLEWRPKSWFVEKGGNYVKKYARAPEKSRLAGARPVPSDVEHQVDKSYQQAYEDLPREIRTYEHSVLPWLMSEIDEHRGRGELVNTSPFPVGSSEWLRSFWLMQTLHHRWPWQACTLRKTKRRPQTSRRGRRFRRSPSVTALAPTTRT